MAVSNHRTGGVNCSGILILRLSPTWGLGSRIRGNDLNKGIQRLQNQGTTPIIQADFNLVEIYDKYEEDFKSQLLDRLHELTPNQFEEFARKLLQVYGFVDVNVTETGPDGGIDGYGKLKVGLAYMNVAFQCKRSSGNGV